MSLRLHFTSAQAYYLLLCLFSLDSPVVVTVSLRILLLDIAVCVHKYLSDMPKNTATSSGSSSIATKLSNPHRQVSKCRVPFGFLCAKSLSFTWYLSILKDTRLRLCALTRYSYAHTHKQKHMYAYKSDASEFLSRKLQLFYTEISHWQIGFSLGLLSCVQ